MLNGIRTAMTSCACASSTTNRWTRVNSKASRRAFRRSFRRYARGVPGAVQGLQRPRPARWTFVKNITSAAKAMAKNSAVPSEKRKLAEQ